MPMRITAGLTRKAGLPGYGSLGASCAVEIELEQSALQCNPAVVQSRIAALYELCRQAVQQQLADYQSVEESSSDTIANDSNSSAPQQVPNTARHEAAAAMLATERQLTFAYHLARQIRTLGGQRVRELAHQLYQRSLEELTSAEASQLIDLLKELRAGKRNLNDLLPGTAA
jgi:hypothetical protein